MSHFVSVCYLSWIVLLYVTFVVLFCYESVNKKHREVLHYGLGCKTNQVHVTEGKKGGKKDLIKEGIKKEGKKEIKKERKKAQCSWIGHL